MIEPVSPAWWRDFFHGVAVDLWLAFESAQQNRAEADFLERSLAIPPGGLVLDVPCGHGRLAFELAARGFQVTGVDLSADFLEAAGRRSAEGGASVAFERRDMRDLPWPGRFDAAFCFGNSFGYLEHDENLDFLRAVAASLKPGGRFAIDTGLIAESALPNLQQRRWFEVGGIHFLIENRYDVRTARLETEYTFIRNGQVDKRRGSQQIYTCRELCELLGKAGFGEFETCSSADSTPFEFGAQRLLLVARRMPGGPSLV